MNSSNCKLYLHLLFLQARGNPHKMGIKIEFNPDFALRPYNTSGRLPEECLPERLEEEKIYCFLKEGQRNYWLEGEVPLIMSGTEENRTIYGAAVPEHPKVPNKPRPLGCGKRKDFLITEGNEKLSRPVASIIILTATHKKEENITHQIKEYISRDLLKMTDLTNISEKYRAKKYSDIISQDLAIVEIKKFLQEFPKKKGVILHGPAGTGKTSLALAAVYENNYDVLELNASDLRNRAKLEEVLKPATLQQSLFKKGKILLMDEVDGVTGTDIGGIPELIRILEETKHPIIMTCNDIW